ncbi:MAG: hypothetical protein RLZZ135_482 [Cyanobacteriota bacterium]|jgi:hypothetical protein
MSFEPIVELKSRGQKAIQYMRANDYKVRALNIIYFEGLDTDLVTVNDDKIDLWNDVRAVIADTGDVLMCCASTSEPGWYYRIKPMNPNGAAQLAFGQHLNAWQLGDHRGQDALVQCGNVKIFRDKNQDGSRKGDAIFVGDDFGLNHHTTSREPERVGKWSAGCLVGRYPSTHAKFMQICRAMGLATFDSTLIDGIEFTIWDKNFNQCNLPVSGKSLY